MFVTVLPFSETFRSYILEVVVCLLFLSLKMLRPLSGQTVRGVAMIINVNMYLILFPVIFDFVTCGSYGNIFNIFIEP